MRLRYICLVVLSLAGSALANPSATAFFPSADASGICADTPLRITFASVPTLGTAGKIQIFDAADNKVVETIDVSSPVASKTIGGAANYRYYPVIIAGNVASIYPKDGSLSYNKSYYVTIDHGVFKDDSAEYAGIEKPTDWRFSTRPAGPSSDAAKITVAADGSGDFCTVQGAFDFIPDGNTTPRTIFVKKGTYTELNYVANKHAVTLLGEDRKETVISYANSAKVNPGGNRRAMIYVQRCDDFTLANLTLRNTHPRGTGGTQAETIILNGSNTARARIMDVDLISFQDTLQINGQTYVSNSYIEGDVDFMWGKGATFFENCQCYCVTGNVYYTQIRNPANVHGFVYYHCTFDGKPGVTGAGLSQIQPGPYPYSEVVLIDCVVDKAVGDVGWRVSGNATDNLHFWEFNSHTPDGKPIDASKRHAASKQLKETEDAERIANYSNPFWVLGQTWIPLTARATTASVKANEAVAFSAATGAPSLNAKYQWLKDGKEIARANGAVFQIPNFSAADSGEYSVIVNSKPSAAAKVSLAK